MKVTNFAGKILAVGMAGGVLLSVLGMAEPANASTVESAKAATCSIKNVALTAAKSGTAVMESCGAKVSVSLGTPKTVTAKEILADSSLSSAQKTDLVAAAAVHVIKTNHWSQFTTGGTYTRTQNGQFYYDGKEVWVTESRYGWQGSHACFTNYAGPGVDLSDKACSESGTLNQRNLYSAWTVRVVVAGVQVASYDVDMTAVLYPNGTISGFGGTVG